MASDRKSNYVFFERRVRDDKDIESLLLQDDDNEDSEENVEWVVQKSAKKTTSSPNQKRQISGSTRVNRQPSGFTSPRKATEIVSPIKIKRKLSYAVDKVETPPKKRPDIKRTKSALPANLSDESVSETEGTSRTRKTSPKKRKTYFEPPRKSKPSNLKLIGSEGDEQAIKRTPSRRCKLHMNAIKNTDDESSDDELLLPLSLKKTPRVPINQGEEGPTHSVNGNDSPRKAKGTPSKTQASVTTSGSPSSIKRHADTLLSSSDGLSRVLNALEAVKSMDFSPSKLSNGLKVNSPRTTAKHQSRDCDDNPSKRLVNGHDKVDAESDTENFDSSNTMRTQPRRGSRSLLKTPSKNGSSSGVGTPVGKGRTDRTPARKEGLNSGDALSKADATPEKGSTPGKPVTRSTRSTPAKGTTPSKSTTPAKPSAVVIPVSSSEDEEELATPLRQSYKRAAKSKPPPKVETPLKRTMTTPMKTPLRRSTRVSMSPSTPSLRQKVLLANTPRSSLPPLKDESESEEEFVTPRKTPKSAKKKLDLTPSTPSSCRKVGHGFLSPVVAEREKRGPSAPSSDLDIARAQLQVSTLPKSLPCREKEFGDIKNFIVRKLKDGTGGCMYVSGVPGTGKTATVHTVVRALQKMAEDRELPAFDFVEVNGLRLTEPRQAYVRIWQCLSKNKLTPDQSLKNLETKFNGKPKRSTVLLVDELDYLCNRRQDVIYNILDWTTKRYSKLVVLTIANTMDLPERTLKGKVTSRMGLTRLVFQPYNFHQLEEIVLNRLDGCKAFNPDAVQLVARKVAAVSGDARRALDICRRSTEILALEGKSNVSVLDIQKVLTQIFAGSRVQAIKNCSVMAKLVLRAIKDEVLRTGVEETTIAFIHPQLVSICALEGKREPAITDLLAICSNLADSGLVFVEKGRKDVNRKISLNVSADDIHYAISC